MKYVYQIIIFSVILFFYMHIHFQLKTSNDYEIYQLDQVNNTKINEICDLRQPVVFNYNSRLLDVCKIKELKDKYKNVDLNIRDITDFDDKSEFFIPLDFANSIQLLESDSNQRYITERNSTFINDSKLQSIFKENDAFLKPFATTISEYDLISGSKGSFTPLQYQINYRNFYYVTEGSTNIKLTPPVNSKYLHITSDYDNFEFRSEINPWNCQEKYQSEFQKIRFLDITLTPGMILYIPAYWNYSIQFTENTTVCNFKYRTLINTITVSPHLFLHFLQKTNIKYTTAKKVKDLSEQPSQSNETQNQSTASETSKEELNSFGQPKTIEEMSVEERHKIDSEVSLQQTQNKTQVNISNDHEQLIRPALESPQKDSTPISELVSSI